MNRLEIRRKEVMNRGEKVLTCFLPLGDPDLDTSRKVVDIFLESGVDIVELGLPSQNPYLDSKQIDESNKRSLASQPEYSRYFETIKSIRDDYPDEPFEVMAYSDTVRSYGVAAFVQSLNYSDVDGHLLADATVIGPDIIEEMDPLLEPLGIYRIRFMPHPFDDGLLPDIAKKARGFMILQSIAAPSGDRATVSKGNKDLIEKIRATETRAAILLAYGINNGARAKEAVRLGPDGILVGTAMVERIAKKDFADLARIVRELKEATLP